jgi:hypothetical protein
MHFAAILPIILMVANLAMHGHVTPNLHNFRMARQSAGKTVLLPGLLNRSHARMLARTGQVQYVPVTPAAPAVPAVPVQPMPKVVVPVVPAQPVLEPLPLPPEAVVVRMARLPMPPLGRNQ